MLLEIWHLCFQEQLRAGWIKAIQDWPPGQLKPRHKSMLLFTWKWVGASTYLFKKKALRRRTLGGAWILQWWVPIHSPKVDEISLCVTYSEAQSIGTQANRFKTAGTRRDTTQLKCLLSWGDIWKLLKRSQRRHLLKVHQTWACSNTG